MLTWDPVDSVYAGAVRYGQRDSSCQVLLIGEDNPYGATPEYALYPMPTGCSGNRLCKDILALRQVTYLGMWRTNLCDGTWSIKSARGRAMTLLDPDAPWKTLVLLGRKVADAFSVALEGRKLAAFTTAKCCPGVTLISLPHPSGRNTVWNNESVRANARMLLAREVPSVPWGEALGDPR